MHAAKDILRTHAERTSWTELTPPEDVDSFYRALDRSSDEVRLRTLGTSREGRELLLVTLARPGVEDARGAHATGKPVVLIAAQVHGDEPAGKEGLMLFARDLVHGPLNALLDDVIFVLVPQLNPDGATLGAWGTRTNGEGFDLNRDYLQLDHPEIRAIVEEVIVAWQPHVVVDAHELSGPPRVYDFYTLGPDNINGPDGPADFTRERVIPAVVEAVEGAGFTHFVYHVAADDPARGLSGDLHGARALTAYAGAHGAISILFETLRAGDARIGIERRVGIHRLALEALADFVVQNREEVVAMVADGRREMVRRGAAVSPADSIAVRVELVAGREVSYRVAGSGAGIAGSGFRGSVPAGDVVELRVPLLDSAVVTLSRMRPVGYAIEAHRSDLAHHLARHGLRVERTLQPLVLDVEVFRVDSLRAEVAAPEDEQAPQLWTTAHPATLSLPAGSYLVFAAQPSSALLFHLLEPEDDNSYASTGAFEREAIRGRTLPVYRLLARPPVNGAVESFP
jgi:dipeptidyl-peptidase 4